MKPLVPVSAGVRVLLGAGFFIIFVGVWALTTYSGWVPPLFLASPGKTLAAGWSLLTEFGFAGDIAITGQGDHRAVVMALDEPGADDLSDDDGH